MVVDLRTVGLISASARTAEHDDLPAPDFPASPNPNPTICAHGSKCARCWETP